MKPPPQLELKGICKSYSGTVANVGISMRTYKGEIQALLGENGAGKSTLVNIICGTIQPDAGEIFFEGQPWVISSPKVARKLGIGVVFQHFALFDVLTVLENIALSIQYSGKMADLREYTLETSQKYGLEVNPDQPIIKLSAGEKQRVEILRCLLQQPKLLILDEPTSVLTPIEVDKLFELLHQLAAEGVSLLFIGHKLKEIKALCSRAIILHKGKLVDECNPQITETKKIVEMMIQDTSNSLPANRNHQSGKEILSIPDLQLAEPDQPEFQLVIKELALNEGTIYGVAGIAGNGQDLLLQALNGECLSPKGNEILFKQHDIGQHSPLQRLQAGIICVPTERLGRATIAEMSLTENSILGAHPNQALTNKWNLLNFSQAKDLTEQIIAQFNVQASGTQAKASSLSGGNLQKYILGRAIVQQPKVLVVYNPTWGVDVASASIIRQQLIELGNQGTAILLISEDLEELFEVADYIATIHAGKLHPMQLVRHTDSEKIGKKMLGL